MQKELRAVTLIFCSILLFTLWGLYAAFHPQFVGISLFAFFILLTGGMAVADFFLIRYLYIVLPKGEVLLFRKYYFGNIQESIIRKVDSPRWFYFAVIADSLFCAALGSLAIFGMYASFAFLTI